MDAEQPTSIRDKLLQGRQRPIAEALMVEIQHECVQLIQAGRQLLQRADMAEGVSV